MRILILGAGGQGQVLADALLFAAEAGHPVTPVGYLDDNPSLWQCAPLGLPVLGALAAWRDIAHDALLLGIGANRRRRELYTALTVEGAHFTALRHPTALMGHDVVVGPGSYIGAYVILAVGVMVGANVIVHGNAVIGYHQAHWQALEDEERLTMTVVFTARQRQTVELSRSEAQAEVFWLAFQALPEVAQQAVRKRLLPDPELPPVLVAELESWQTAAAEALMNFAAMIDEMKL